MVVSFVVAAQHLKGIPGWLTDTVRGMELVVIAGTALLAYVLLHKSHAHAMAR